MSTGQTTQLKSRGQLSNNKGIKLEASNRKLTETRRGLAEEGGPAENWAGVGKRPPGVRLGCAMGQEDPDLRLRGASCERPSPVLRGYPKLFSQGGGESLCLKSFFQSRKIVKYK